MTKQESSKAFKEIYYELRINKPNISPYSDNVIKKRTFLLYAQVHLANILDAKLKRDEWDEEFEIEMYNKIKRIYYNWDKNEQEYS